MRNGNKNRFRVGQTVQSVYDPTHTFVIDRSLVPERIFHEKGSGRWWTKNELQTLGAPENPLTSTPPERQGKMRAKCAQCVPGYRQRPADRHWRPRWPARARLPGMRHKIPASATVAKV